jgi:hypothetical protein
MVLSYCINRDTPTWKQGTIRIKDDRGSIRKYSWEAREKDGSWKISGDGAFSPAGQRIGDTVNFPFLTDSVGNLGIKDILRELLGIDDNAQPKAEPKPAAEESAPAAPAPAPAQAFESEGDFPDWQYVEKLGPRVITSDGNQHLSNDVLVLVCYEISRRNAFMVSDKLGIPLNEVCKSIYNAFNLLGFDRIEEISAALRVCSCSKVKK